MTTLAVALKEEIRRLARKEIKAQTGAMAQAVTRVATRNRPAQAAGAGTREDDRVLGSSGNASVMGNRSLPAVRPKVCGFSARSVKAQRKRAGLSAADYAKLVGVSALTIYNWEQGKSRPRKEQLASLVALRGLGKREAGAKLELLNSRASTSSTTGKARRKNDKRQDGTGIVAAGTRRNALIKPPTPVFPWLAIHHLEDGRRCVR